MMRWVAFGLGSAGVLGIAVACSGEDFSSTGTGGAGPDASLGGAAGAGGNAGGTTSGGAAGATGGGGSGGVAGSGGSAGAADSGSGGAGGATCKPFTGSSLLLASGLQSPEYPVISDGYVYFSTSLDIRRVKVDGGAVETLHSAGSPTANEGIAVHGGFVYWVDRGAGEIRRLEIAKPSNWSSVATGQPNPQTVAVDGAYVYFTHAGGIRRTSTTTPGAPIDAFSSNGAYAVALGPSEVFWATTAGDVRKGTKGSSSVVPLGAKPNPNGGAWAAVSIALDSTHVYVAMRGDPTSVADGAMPPDGVWRVTRSAGGSMEQVASGSAAEGLAVDSSCFYFGSRHQNGRIYTRPVSLASSQVSAVNNLGWPRGIAFDALHVYWTDTMTGDLRRMAK